MSRALAVAQFIAIYGIALAIVPGFVLAFVPACVVFKSNFIAREPAFQSKFSAFVPAA